MINAVFSFSDVILFATFIIALLTYINEQKKEIVIFLIRQ